MVNHLTYTYRVALFVFVCRRYRTPFALASLPRLPPPPPLHPPFVMLTYSPSELTPLALHPLLSFAVLSRCFVFYKLELALSPAVLFTLIVLFLRRFLYFTNRIMR